MAMSRLVVLSFLLALSTSANPLVQRTNDVVQGKLGSDGFWNDYDGGQNNYVQYTGNGSSTAGWPSHLSWISFNDMWTANQKTLQRSCGVLYQAPNLSDQEIQDLYDAIKIVSQQTRVDHRFILAAAMQETGGCVRAKTSLSPDGTVHNPGILQSFNGTHSCNDNGKMQNPCPRDQIIGMIQDGVAGTTNNGHGYVSDLNDQSAVDSVEFAEAHYRAARLYNSGEIDESGDLGKGSATHCYSSDIANRLTGWTDSPKLCTLDDK